MVLELEPGSFIAAWSSSCIPQKLAGWQPGLRKLCPGAPLFGFSGAFPPALGIVANPRRRFSGITLIRGEPLSQHHLPAPFAFQTHRRD